MKAKWIPLLIFIVVSVFLWRGLHRDPHLIPSPLINKPFPVEITNVDLKGHITVLNIFATWCVSCQTEHTVLMKIAKNSNIVLDGLDYKDNKTIAQEWFKKVGNPYHQILDDPQGQLAINLGVYGTPETFIIDQNGIIREKYVGPITMMVWKNQLLPKIKKLQT